MNKFHQIAALLLAASILSACAGGAADNKDSVQTATADNAETTAAVVEDGRGPCNLPDTDWEGRQFRVLGYEHSRSQFCTFEIDAEGINGEVVNDAIFNRNAALESKYNVDIVEIKYQSDDIGVDTAPAIRAAVNANEDLYDCSFTTIAAIGALAREGFFYNLYDLDYIDFEQVWWNASLNESLSLYNKLYFTSSDFSLRDKSRTHILVYNKDMMSRYDLGDIMETVRAGKWTIDEMGRLAKAVSNDVNGDGKVDDGDIFGFGLDAHNSFPCLYFAADNTILSKDADGAPILTFNNERTVSTLDKLLDFTGLTNVTAICNDWQNKVDYDYWSVSSKLFNEGRSLFNASFPHGLSGLSSNCTDDYGVIPLPKYDETQDEYYTMANRYAMLFAVPITCAEPDFSGFMLEALSHASDTTLDAYYEVSCKTKYTYDEDSAEMLDLIFSNIRYDLATVYSISAVSSILPNISSAKKNNFASEYAKIEKRANVELEKLQKNLLGDD